MEPSTDRCGEVVHYMPIPDIMNPEEEVCICGRFKITDARVRHDEIVGLYISDEERRTE